MLGEDISLDVSDSSMVLPVIGADNAITAVKAKPKFAEFVCSPYEVDSFVKSVIHDVIPRDFWGSSANQKLVLARGLISTSTF